MDWKMASHCATWTSSVLNKLMLQHYYKICCTVDDIIVTTSCFAAWHKRKLTNGNAKIIPVVPNDAGLDDVEPRRVFFFDDNVNLRLGSSAGTADAPGDCNLRCIKSGDFVDFSAGCNGFQRERIYEHTLVHHSSEYRCVVVQANILEAMALEDYFSGIMQRYTHPGEKVIVVMDVNGTILCGDSTMRLGPSKIILEAMCTLLELRPSKAFVFEWKGSEVSLGLEHISFKDFLLAHLANKSRDVFNDILDVDIVVELFKQLQVDALLAWSEHDERVSLDEFRNTYAKYMAVFTQQSDDDRNGQGLTKSWFKCLSILREGGKGNRVGSVVINSFGTDTQAVLKRSVPDVQRIFHVAVNFEMWSKFDQKRYTEQFKDDDDDKSAETLQKTCRACDDPYSGFGQTCSKCRKLGHRGSVLQCSKCLGFFSGVRPLCPECWKSFDPTASQELAMMMPDNSTKRATTFDGSAPVARTPSQ